MKYRFNIKNKIKKLASVVTGLYRFFFIIQRRFTYEHGGMLLAGSLSFYLVVSIVPLLLVVTTIFTSIAHSSDLVYNAIIDFFEAWMPAVTQPTVSVLNGFIQGRVSIGIISVIFLLWSAGLFLDATIQAIDRIWNVEERWPFWKRKLLSLLVIPIFITAFGISFGFTAFISFMRTLNIGIMGRSISGIAWLWGVVGISTSLILTIIFLFWFYKVVPHVAVSNRSALIGAVFAGCSWEIAKYVFDWYIARFTGFNRIYGNLGGVFIGLLWVYYTAIIILLGAELAGYYEERGNTILLAKGGG
ncbi:hypothetical protein CH333_07425 [candidate division WOR-3 bacterium JGI_Cruoil_03_44_89]|uniref:YihY/virulence factor BrkB family protein n=1 Tax=candidate division WOR-3 bacterium JGI_Cruoil_03_44_89 TaxID=1973748 RepID=A0A235BQD6_UNCW3|nr:MAG: hypothetical protein CH333_07425 [candidate division WOR-3 bacterium JGI_Cruoil_03_44_89]